METDRIICGDCLEILRDFDDNSVDLVLTDPPYGVGMEYDVYEDTEEKWYDLMTKLVPECMRLSSMTIMPAGNRVALGWIYANIPPDWLICWYKGSPGCRSFVGFNDWEPLLVYGKNEGVQMHDFMACTPKPFDNGHPCPKPINWAVWLIDRTTKPNDLILDPFCGSGTTCVAAKMLGRHYIGIDISNDYCEIARKRIAAAEKGITVKELEKGQGVLF